MKAARLVSYVKTKGELRHEAEVKQAKNNGFANPGSISKRKLSIIVKNNLYPVSRNVTGYALHNLNAMLNPKHIAERVMNMR